MRLVVLRFTVLPKPRSSPGGVGGMGVGSGSGSGGMPTSDGMVTESSSASVVEPSEIQPLAGLGLRWMTRLWPGSSSMFLSTVVPPYAAHTWQRVMG